MFIIIPVRSLTHIIYLYMIKAVCIFNVKPIRGVVFYSE